VYNKLYFIASFYQYRYSALFANVRFLQNGSIFNIHVNLLLKSKVRGSGYFH